MYPASQCFSDDKIQNVIFDIDIVYDDNIYIYLVYTRRSLK